MKRTTMLVLCFTLFFHSGLSFAEEDEGGINAFINGFAELIFNLGWPTAEYTGFRFQVSVTSCGMEHIISS